MHQEGLTFYSQCLDLIGTYSMVIVNLSLPLVTGCPPPCLINPYSLSTNSELFPFLHPGFLSLFRSKALLKSTFPSLTHSLINLSSLTTNSELFPFLLPGCLSLLKRRAPL